MLKKELGMFGVLVALVVLIALANPSFYGSYNLQNLSRHIALLALFAIGEAFVIISGGIDLSVGSIIGFTGVFIAVLTIKLGFPLMPALILGILLALGIGFMHGLLITRLSLQPFIVTLGGMMIFRGLAQTLTEGGNIGFGSKFLKFRSIGTGSWLGFPIPLWILVVVAGICFFVMKYTLYGRYLYALGGNKEAVRFSGVSVNKIQIGAYVVSAGLAGLAGIIYAAYLPSVSPSVGTAYELYAIAAAVLGGCSLNGGEGSILGVVIGASIMRVMNNGIILMGISSFWEYTVIGIVIIAAVIFDRFFQSKNSS